MRAQPSKEAAALVAAEAAKVMVVEAGAKLVKPAQKAPMQMLQHSPHLQSSRQQTRVRCNVRQLQLQLLM